MKSRLNIYLNNFLIIFILGCNSNSTKIKNPVSDLKINSYEFIYDTLEIRNLVKDMTSPSGRPFNAKDLQNRFIKISFTNVLSNNIYFSKHELTYPIDSLRLSYCTVTRFSTDSIVWKTPMKTSDYFTSFNDTILPGQTSIRIIQIDLDIPKGTKYFDVSIRYRVDSTIPTKEFIFKL